MGKAGRWLKNLLQGKKDEKKVDDFSAALPSELQSARFSVQAKEKKRWSFRRSMANGKKMHSPELSISAPVLVDVDADQKRPAITFTVVTAAIKEQNNDSEEAAARKIQSVFRSYLARKALCGLRGFVKLQALVRGQLVRKQAAETLRCMEALVSAQARICAQRISMLEEPSFTPQRQSMHMRTPPHPRYKQPYEIDKNKRQNVKDMDSGVSRCNMKSRRSHSIAQPDIKDKRFSEYYGDCYATPKAEQCPQFSPAPTSFTEMSPMAYSSHFEDFSFITAQSSPYFSAVSVLDPTIFPTDYGFLPNYMANTESSRAKARSQSAPRQREDAFERQTSRRKPASESRNLPKGLKMQRTSANWYPSSIRSSASVKDSDCGSTSTGLTNDIYSMLSVGFDARSYK